MRGFTAKLLGEGFLADVAGKVHGLVEDAGDFDLAGLNSVNEEVLAAAKGADALHDFIESFASKSEWIFCDALDCRFDHILIDRSLIFAPELESV
jgi:hypothetical protein